MFEKSVYSDRYVQLSSQRTSQEPLIKVAVLDSGIELEDPAIASHIKRIAYKDFITNDQRPCDIAGHGTHTAAILIGMARNAELLVARVTEGLTVKYPDKIAEVSITQTFHSTYLDHLLLGAYVCC